MNNLPYNPFEEGRINPDNLDKSNYTLSLAAEAARTGLWSEEEYSAFKLRVFEKLADHILLYMHGDSSSVESATAARLLGSVMYNCDLVLTRIQPEASLKRLRDDSIDNIYCDGLRISRDLKLKALSMLREVKRTRIDVPDVYYNKLLNDALPELIRSYDMQFDAKRNFTDVDYTLPTVNKSVCGIGGILHLLGELINENRFVNSFASEDLRLLWRRYMRELANPAGDMLSLGQLVFEQALLSLAAGEPEPIVPLDIRSARILAELFKGEEAYYAALNVVHRLEGRDGVADNYIPKLLKLYRPRLKMLFSGDTVEERAMAVRRYCGIYTH